MISQLRRVAGVLCAIALALVGLSSSALAQATTTTFVLPDGSVCEWHGGAQAPVLNGQPVNYTCNTQTSGNQNVILGTPTLQNGVWVINRGVMAQNANGFSLVSSNTIQVDITRVELTGGLSCDFAGPSGGGTINGQRINYTCGPDNYLIGNFTTSQPLWTATRVVAPGGPSNFTVTSTETPGIGRAITQPAGGGAPPTTTTLVLPDGSICTWRTTSSPPTFNGQPVNYTCNTTTNGNQNIILGTPTLQNGAWTINTGVMAQNNNGVSLVSSSTLTVDITRVDLTTNTSCDFAGKGATATINGQRINYTCGQDTYLIGDFNTSQPLWTTQRVVATGSPSNFTVTSSDTPGIGRAVAQNATSTPGGATTTFVLPDGSVCDWHGGSQAPVLNGQPVNYTCNTSTNGNQNIILGTPSLQNGVWVISTGVMAPNNTLVSSSSIQVDITQVVLVDSNSCNFTGKGAGATINGQRINYQCVPPNMYLIGDFNTSQPQWTASRVIATGGPSAFTVTSSDMPGIVRAVTQPATGVTPPPNPNPAPTAPPMAHDDRYFNETKFRIDNDAFYNFFTTRGGTETFGFPVSRQFGFLGCQVQIFQRSVMQQCQTNGPVALLNLLDPEIFPYNKVNGSTFPPADDAIKNRTPVPGTPGYDQAIIQFVQQVAPDQFNGQPVNYYQTFNNTGGLEIWGAPISNPAPDPGNANFIYQRFQRGIMHYTVGQGTRGILLADYLKAIILGPTEAAAKGASLPADLSQQAQGSAQYAQYCPGNTLWLCRPQALPGTDLTYAFEVG